MRNATATPSLGRSGTYYHEPTNQFCSRIGFCLNAAGKRVRASQNLGTPDNADAATISVLQEPLDRHHRGTDHRRTLRRCRRRC
jgi:hypothetical protein